MTGLPDKKSSRQKKLAAYLRKNPFTTDHELAKSFAVSVQTIRLDRVALGIPQVRERVKAVARGAYTQLKSAEAREEIIGELIDIQLNQSGISLLEIEDGMVFKRNEFARAHYLFAQANSLAVAVIDAPLVLTSSARVRYKRPVKQGDRVVAKAKVKIQRGNTYLVSVYSYVEQDIVFKGQFIVTVSK